MDQITTGAQFKLKIQVHCRTWHRESYSLFDYENKQTYDSNYDIRSEGILSRVENQVSLYNRKQFSQLPYTAVGLIEFVERQGMATIQSPSFGQCLNKLDKLRYEKLWLCVKNLRQSGQKGYQLCENDVVRMGRLKFRVRELVSDQEQTPTPINIAEFLSLYSENQDEWGNEDQASSIPCRICLSEFYTAQNPLISVCKCTGTMKFVHIQCLQRWMKSRLIQKSTENYLTLSWNMLNCELCKQTFPFRLPINGKSTEIIHIPRPPGNYIILEALKKERDGNNSLHVISFNNKSLMKLGRGHDSDFRVSDISFSRSHASIRLSKGKYYFEDFNSKFGSLVQVKRPLILDNSSDILIQTGRTLIEIKAKKPWSLFPSCLFSNVRQKDDINTLEQDNLPLFPFNTGISLSSNFSPKKSTPKSILYKNFGFGKNSSIESEEPDFLIVEPYILPDNPLETSEGDPDLD